MRKSSSLHFVALHIFINISTKAIASVTRPINDATSKKLRKIILMLEHRPHRIGCAMNESDSSKLHKSQIKQLTHSLRASLADTAFPPKLQNNRCFAVWRRKRGTTRHCIFSRPAKKIEGSRSPPPPAEPQNWRFSPRPGGSLHLVEAVGGRDISSRTFPPPHPHFHRRC